MVLPSSAAARECPAINPTHLPYSTGRRVNFYLSRSPRILFLRLRTPRQRCFSAIACSSSLVKGSEMLQNLSGNAYRTRLLSISQEVSIYKQQQKSETKQMRTTRNYCTSISPASNQEQSEQLVPPPIPSCLRPDPLSPRCL